VPRQLPVQWAQRVLLPRLRMGGVFTFNRQSVSKTSRQLWTKPDAVSSSTKRDEKSSCCVTDVPQGIMKVNFKYRSVKFSEVRDQFVWYKVPRLTWKSLRFAHRMLLCVFCTDFRTNSDYFTIKHLLTGFYSRDGVCLLRGTFCPHNVFMCFVWIWEQTAIISLYNINWLVFITEMECDYCAVRIRLQTKCLKVSKNCWLQTKCLKVSKNC
jgi:hypothetical protein